MRTRERRTGGTKSTRRVFLLPDFTLALSLARLRALFAAFGLPAKLSLRATHQAMARALFGGDLPSPLADALEEIARLACEDGRRALLEAALSLGVDTRGWPIHEGVADLAAYIVLLAKKNDAVAKVVRRAHVRQNRLLSPSMSYELAAAFEATDRDCAASLAKGVTRALGDDVWTTTDQQGRLHLAVLYRAPGEAAIVDGVRIVTRPLRADWLRIDFDARRIFVVTATPERLHAYGAIVGETAWGDARAFGERPSITFKPIQERRAGALDAVTLPHGVRKITVTAWQLDAGDGSRHEVRANDALPTLETHVQIVGGYFSRLNVRVDIDDAPGVGLMSNQRLQEGKIPHEAETRVLRYPFEIPEVGHDVSQRQCGLVVPLKAYVDVDQFRQIVAVQLYERAVMELSCLQESPRKPRRCGDVR